MAQVILLRRNRKTEGGAREHTRGLGCGSALDTGPTSVGPVLVFLTLIGLALGLVAPAQALDLPSGQSATPVDILWEDQAGETALVLRALTPAIARDGGTLGYEEVSADFDALCADVALPVMAATGSAVARVVIVLMDRVVDRGIPDPEATQFIADYRIEDGRCMLEFF